jgi:hypothetical protein
MSSTLSSICTGLMSAFACIISTCVVAEFGYRFHTHLHHFDELDEAPLNGYGVVDLREHKSAALFLYNTTVEHHHDFLHDVKVANARHPVPVFQLECTYHKSICGSYRHGAHTVHSPL